MMRCNFRCINCTLGKHDSCELPTKCHVTSGGIEDNN